MSLCSSTQYSIECVKESSATNSSEVYVTDNLSREHQVWFILLHSIIVLIVVNHKFSLLKVQGDTLKQVYI